MFGPSINFPPHKNTRHLPSCGGGKGEFLQLSKPSLIPSNRSPANPFPSNQVLSNLRSLTASLFGIASGILGLESWHGFLFYLVGMLVVSALVYGIMARGRSEMYFQSPVRDLWVGDLVGGLSSFVMTWTLFYGLVGG
jgi:hypothetical protein